ncbi:arylformamidase [Nitrobacteraceae bacterium AZCC 2161]
MHPRNRFSLSILQACNAPLATRRRVLLGGLAAALVGTAANAADAAKVYGDYTQAELDGVMDQTRWAPNMMATLAKSKPASEATRAKLKALPIMRYGDGANEDMEIFPSAQAGAPIVFFIHGGEWKRAGRDASAFPASTLVPAGCTFVNVNFDAAPQVRLTDMVDQVRRAFIQIYKNAESIGGDPKKIFILGHSSGAHLAAVLLTCDWKAYGLPADPVRGAVLLSGLYDLEPVVLSMRREWVKLSAAEVAALSPIQHVTAITAPTTIVFGSHDSPEFQRQGRAFAALVTARVPHSTLVVAEGLNHFEIPQTLNEADGIVTRLVLARVQQNA